MFYLFKYISQTGSLCLIGIEGWAVRTFLTQAVFAEKTGNVDSIYLLLAGNQKYYIKLFFLHH